MFLDIASTHQGEIVGAFHEAACCRVRGSPKPDGQICTLGVLSWVVQLKQAKVVVKGKKHAKSTHLSLAFFLLLCTNLVYLASPPELVFPFYLPGS
jgi:hypothetical protein